MTALAAVAQEADGYVERAEMARACGDLWAAALGRYLEDARSFLNGAKQGHDEGEALDDLTGSRRLLGALCEPIGADPDRMAAAMIEAIDSGLRFRQSGMNRVVPEIHDDYRLGAWRDKTKRKGKAQAITLG